MSPTLFRAEAIAARSGSRFASTPLPLPPGVRALIALAFSLAATVIALLLFGEYAPRDTVRGYLTTTAGDVRVHASGAGTIRRLLVSDGDPVRRGQPLLLLETSRAVARSKGTQAAVLSGLQAERDALIAERDSFEETIAIQARRYTDEIRRLEQQRDLLGEQRQTLVESERIAQRALARLQQLIGKGYVSEREKDEAKAHTHDIRLRLQQLDVEIRAADSAVEHNQSLLQELPYLRRQRVAELQSSLQRLATRIAEEQGFAEQAVEAPASGVVTGLLVREGQTVSPSSTLLSIVPLETSFRAELLIPTRTIAFVRSGAAVRIRYDALPYQTHGTFSGVISAVSRTTTLPADKAFPLPVTEATYLARVELDALSPANSSAARLQSGMTFTADIMRDRRRLFAWLFDPLVAAGDRL